MEQNEIKVTETQIHAELNDFTSSVKNNCRPPLDTSEHDIACCLPFATEQHSQCWWSPVRCCLSRLLWCMVCHCTLSPSGSPKVEKMEKSNVANNEARVSIKWFCLTVEQWLMQWKQMPLIEICSEHGKVTHAHSQHEQAMLLKQAWSFKNYGLKWSRHSICITLHREKGSQTIITATQSKERCYNICGVVQSLSPPPPLACNNCHQIFSFPV